MQKKLESEKKQAQRELEKKMREQQKQMEKDEKNRLKQEREEQKKKEREEKEKIKEEERSMIIFLFWKTVWKLNVIHQMLVLCSIVSSNMLETPPIYVQLL